MTALRTMLKSAAGLLAAGILAATTASAALAADVRFTVRNNTSGTITLDTSSCTSGSIFPPFSISAGNMATFTGSTSGTTTLCTVRYHNSAGGCQFQVQTVFFPPNSPTGFASTNAYKGSAGCSENSEGPLSNGWFGDFTYN
jgi:hypothetical protein